MKSDSSIILGLAGLIEDEKFVDKTNQRLAKEGLSSQVRFLGARSDVHVILMAADLYVMPSLREAQGIALLEALQSGVSIVASNIASFQSHCDQPGLALVEVGDTEVYRSAIRSAMTGKRRHQRQLSRTAIQYEALAGDVLRRSLLKIS